MRQTLRPYQIEGVEDVLEAYRAGKRAPILVAATGAGKSTMCGHIVERSVNKGSYVIVMAHRTELIDQLYEKIRSTGVRAGVIRANDPRQDKTAKVQVASVQTLTSRLKRAEESMIAMWIPQADLIITDEAHHFKVGGSYDKVVARYPSALMLGLSATPERTDGAGLAPMFDDLIIVSSPRELMEEGFLCPYEIYESPNSLDFSKVKKIMGDFSEKEVAIIVDKPKVVADVFQTWLKHAEGKPTLVFARNRQHGLHLKEEFLAGGIKAEYVDDKTKADVRARAIKDYLERRITVLINIALFTEGTDLPLTECVQMTWPTMSLNRYLQIVGRGLRPSPGKSHLTLLDHGGNVHRHGLPDDDREWSLEGRKKRAQPKVAPVKTCPSCYATFRPQTRECPRCGFQIIAPDQPIPEYADVALVKRELSPRQLEIQRKKGELIEQRVFLDSVMREFRERPRNHKWPLMQFKNKFGKYPREGHGVKINYESGAHGYTIKSWSFNGETVIGTEAAQLPQPIHFSDEDLFK